MPVTVDTSAGGWSSEYGIGNPTVATPANLATGDLLVLIASGRNNVFALPAGFTDAPVTDQATAFQYGTARVAWMKVGSSVPASVALSNSGEARSFVHLQRVAGADSVAALTNVHNVSDETAGMAVTGDLILAGTYAFDGYFDGVASASWNMQNNAAFAKFYSNTASRASYAAAATKSTIKWPAGAGAGYLALTFNATVAPFYSGGSVATVGLAAAGAGSKRAGGGSATALGLAASGAGSKQGVGGSDGALELLAAGTGAKHASAGSPALLGLVGAGAGSKQSAGSSTATLELTATGSGRNPDRIITTPTERVVVVAAHERAVVMPEDDRTVVVPFDNRTVTA